MVSHKQKIGRSKAGPLVETIGAVLDKFADKVERHEK